MTNKAKLLPMNLLKESVQLDENSPSGLIWKERPLHHFTSKGQWIKFNREKVGKMAGCLDRKKNAKTKWRLKIHKLCYPVHRVVFALHHNLDPGEKLIDHKDGNPLNNNISNLRLADSIENALNKLGIENRTSRYKGVCYIKQWDCWRASISKKGMKRLYLGHFKEEADARDAYREAALKIHGEFAKFELDEHETPLIFNQTTMVPLSEIQHLKP